MELRHIRYFLAVAEEGNFTRAAARLGIGQPPLSMQIRDLEVETGAKLFRRTAKGAELTDAGVAFRAAVAELPNRVLEAVEDARRVARGEGGQLSLGITGTAALNPLVPACIRAFRQSYPEVKLKLREANSFALVQGLLDGQIDIAVLRPDGADRPDLTLQTLIEEPLIAALPATHALAVGSIAFDLALLKNDPVILTPRLEGAGMHDAVVRACREAGFEPILGQPAPQIASILSLVSADLGFTLVPQSMQHLSMAGVTYRRLRKPVVRINLSLAFPAMRKTALVSNFAKTARSVVKGSAG